MNKLILFIIAICLTLPYGALALDYTNCDAGTAQCSCTPDDKIGLDQTTITSVAGCQEACRLLEPYQDDFGGTVTGYSAQCSIGGTLTTLNQGGLEDPIGDGSSVVVSTEEPLETYDVPDLGVEIPGLIFTPAVKINGSVTSNYLGEYIEAVLWFLFPAASLLAVVFIMIGGLQYIMARGKADSKSKAMARIRNATVGVILLFGAIAMAQVVNPKFLQYESLSITHIDKTEWYEPEDFGTIVAPSVPISGNADVIGGEYIINQAEDPYLNPEALTALVNASVMFYESNAEVIKVSSARRTVEKQATMFYDNCLSNSSKSCSVPTCNPAASAGIISGSSSGYTLTGELAGVSDRNTIINTIVSKANFANCPHTSSIAVDVWCNDGGTNYVHDPDCQKKLSEAMIANGFCRIDSEAWHFEFNSMHVSSTCRTTNTHSYTTGGSTYTPNLSCSMWGYRSHSCE